MKLSIIIPCYNCEDTLREAVESCYIQGFAEDEFEIVMVDDKSTDNTRTVIESLTKQYINLSASFHEKNLGGGATRNTAVENCSAAIIFCLDSDDILPEKTLQKMYRHLVKNDLDGVGIHHSIKFFDNDVNKIARIDDFNRVSEDILLTDLFQKDGLCSLYSTFMFTMNAFNKTSGYPTTHGFDTQGFAWRFLAAGNKAQTCPDASYYHRTNLKESYYRREYASGKTNFNWQVIFLENYNLFTEESIRFITEFDCRNFTNDIFTELSQKSNILIPDYKDKLGHHATTRMMPDINPIPRDSALGIIIRIRKRIINFLNAYPKLKSTVLYILHLYQDIAQRMRYPDRIKLIIFYLRLRFMKLLKINFYKENLKSGFDIEIDVIVPTISKDFEMLEIYFSHLKRNVCHKINKIYLIAPENESEIKDFAEKNGFEFISESTVLGYSKNEIPLQSSQKNLRGWILQQLLKLGADNIVGKEHFIVVDSDTILLEPHIFFTKEKTIFQLSTEFCQAYRLGFQEIFRCKPMRYESFVCHMMPFEKTKLKEFKQDIENQTGISWDKSLINVCDENKLMMLSEYEMYGQWFYKKHFSKTKLVPFYNCSRKNIELKKIEKFYGKYTSVSFHSYL